MKIIILGAAGQIARMLTTRLIQESDAELVLYARNATNRLKNPDENRVKIVDGDFNEEAKLVEAMKGADFIYLNDMNSPEATEVIVKAAEQAGQPFLIGATILGIYDEVAGPFGKWNARMVGQTGTNRHKKSAQIFEKSGLDYSLLRLTWLYNEVGNLNYMITQKGEPFIGAQVSREAVTQLILDIVSDPNKYRKTSFGVSEPDTDFAKPSFY
ncbi:NAD(P)H-binding protein [Enterococcus sp. AZ103]|uniref:NAD(P)H-binding protein n=1 Tax=Enterococcus sp. AZ103 TaxID=2774628 RepID=UPI003F1F4460